jgi:Flp pilus assembly pilin Flp
LFKFAHWHRFVLGLNRFRSDRRGTTPLEYALIATITAMICITAIVRTGSGGSAVLAQVASTLVPVQAATPSAAPPFDPDATQSPATESAVKQ